MGPKTLSLARTIVVLSITLVFFTSDAGHVEGGIFTLSEEQEINLGRQIAMQVEAKTPMLNDAFVERYISSVGHRLVRSSERPNLAYRFRVTNLNEINAFALPGGFVYVNRALIAAAGNESELASVMAHEISHVVARHSVEQFERAQKFNLGLGLLGAVLGDKRGGLVDLTKFGAQVGANGFLMKYSRKAETEADTLGVNSLHAAGYDPTGMVSFFQKLQHLRQRQPSLLQNFFSSHPDMDERISHVSRLLAAAPGRSRAIRDTEQFQNVHAYLTGSRGSQYFQQPSPAQRIQTDPRRRRF